MTCYIPGEVRFDDALVAPGIRRTCTPRQTLDRVKALFKPLGITRVANVTGLDCIGIPTVMVTRPNARSLSVSQGKGVDLDAACASGVMESIELYHAERIQKPLLLASWNELRFARSAVDPADLPKTAKSIFHIDRTLLWIEAQDILTGARSWLPYELVHTNYTVPLPSGSGCFVLSSNGLASGNHPLEAIIHGLCECIERDATTLWCLSARDFSDRRRVDLATINDATCADLLARYDVAGIAVGVWDLTSDVGIACFACVVVERSMNAFRLLGPIAGYGCHPVREVALARALTEAAQARLTIIAGSRDDTGRVRHEAAKNETFAEETRRRLNAASTRSFDETPTFQTESLENELDFICQRLRDVGVRRVFAIDLTSEQLKIPVYRVVVPGLEPYHHISDYLPGARALRLLAKRMETGAT
ncbi:MAG TPA: YcaO-like family protein [Polyangiaceae bacterium]|nr:YcaO-like family protein [Polyangiaceae bacterium]